jgi:hypothetical protein
LIGSILLGDALFDDVLFGVVLFGVVLFGVLFGGVLLDDKLLGGKLLGGGLRFTTLLDEGGFPAGRAELDGTAAAGGMESVVAASGGAASGVVANGDNWLGAVDDWYGAGVPTPVAPAIETPVAPIIELLAKGKDELAVEVGFNAGALTPAPVAVGAAAGPTASEPRVVFAVGAMPFCNPCFCTAPTLFWSTLFRDSET